MRALDRRVFARVYDYTEVLAFDINGDLLPDKVFREPFGSVKYRLNQSGPNGVTSFGPAKNVINLNYPIHISIQINFTDECISI